MCPTFVRRYKGEGMLNLPKELKHHSQEVVPKRRKLRYQVGVVDPTQKENLVVLKGR